MEWTLLVQHKGEVGQYNLICTSYQVRQNIWLITFTDLHYASAKCYGHTFFLIEYIIVEILNILGPDNWGSTVQCGWESNNIYVSKQWSFGVC